MYRSSKISLSSCHRWLHRQRGVSPSNTVPGTRYRAHLDTGAAKLRFLKLRGISNARQFQLVSTTRSLDQFIAWLEAQPENTYNWDDCKDCLFARYARTLGVQLGQAWGSLHSDGRIAMELYCQIGSGDGRQCYADALARRSWQQPLASSSHDAVSDLRRARPPRKRFSAICANMPMTRPVHASDEATIVSIGFFLGRRDFLHFPQFLHGVWTQQRLADPAVSK